MANEPVTSAGTDSVQPSKPANVFRTYAQDLAALGGRAAQAVPPRTRPQPKPVAPVVPPLPPRPAPEPPPAYIIPKAPTTQESRETVLERLRESAVPETPQPPMPTLVGTPIPPKAPSTNESREAILNRLRKNAASVNRIEVPRAPAPVVKAPEPVTESAPIHTYKTDFADRIDAKQASTFSVLAAQSDSMGASPKRIKERQRFPAAILMGFLLIAVGGSAIFYALQTVNKQVVVPYVSSVPSLIFADEQVKLVGEGTELMNAWAASTETALKEDGVRIVYTTLASTSPEGTLLDTPLPGGALIAALSLPAPEILIRNVEPKSTVGLVHAGEETRGFFILKVSSYERTFAGMLEWEPRLLADLAPLYPLYPQEVSTTTPAVTALPAFSDEIIANRDVRILRDTTGRSLILYGYRDKETLIIARDEAAFTHLLERLSTSRGQ